MGIASAKEKLELAVLNMQLEKNKEGESCPLEYVKDNIQEELEGCTIVGGKGQPITKLYVKQDGYQYEIRPSGEVIYIGNVEFSEIPELTIVRDTTATGAEKVKLEFETDVEIGSITKIVTPTGEILSETGTYEITQNGEYEFKVVTDKGIETVKKVKIQNIKEEGIDLTGLTMGEEITHNHIYETKYDDIDHWEECIICGIKINKENHTIQTIGNPATCDVYVVLGQKVCSDNCGYSKQIERLNHIRPSVLKWEDYKATRHIAFQCERCGGRGSNSIEENHVFNINGELLTTEQLKNKNINVHSLGIKECTICKLSVDLSKHNCYSNNCYLCNKISGPQITGQIPQNNVQDNKVKIDLVNNTIQTLYFQVDSKGYELSSVSIRSLYGGNYQFTSPTQVSKNGNIYLYKCEIQLKNRNLPITEAITALIEAKTNVKEGDTIEGYIMATTIRGEISLPIIPDNVSPTIENITAVNVKENNGWGTSKQITITGTAKMNQTVYISMYDPNGKSIFEDSAVLVDGNRYEFVVIPNIEVSTAKDFTIQVKDLFGNITTKTISLQKIDSKAPQIDSIIGLDNNWNIRKKAKLEITDEGIGEVQIAFNNSDEYENIEKVENKYVKTYNFIGDVYEDVTGAVYLKDGLGNITTQKLVIGKIDSTSPNITNTSKNGNILTIEANDISEKIGKEGSGVAGYAISTRKELPSDAEFQSKNTFNIEDGKTYYIWVKDNAGNISERYEI